jgi:hypothetical protein
LSLTLNVAKRILHHQHRLGSRDMSSISLERDSRRPLFLLGEYPFTEERSAGERREVRVREDVFLVLNIRGQSQGRKGRRQPSSCRDQAQCLEPRCRPMIVQPLTRGGGRCRRRARIIGRGIGIGTGTGIVVLRVIGRGSHGVVSHPRVSQLGIVGGPRYRKVQSIGCIIQFHRIAAYLETARPCASTPTPVPASEPSR